MVLAPSSQAYDGCGLSAWRCGDVCIGHTVSPCHCGNQTKFFRDHIWCCSNTACEGLGEPKTLAQFGWKEHYSSGATCSSGKVLNLTEPCPNQFSSTNGATKQTLEILGVRKFLESGNGSTNQTREILGGKATKSCNNFDDAIVDIDIDDGLRRYTPCWKPGQEIEGECIKKSEEGDGKYHCNSRSDENPFATQTVDPTSVMKECIDNTTNKAGLDCPGHGCFPFIDWCQSKLSTEGGPKKCELPGEGQYFFSNDKELCSHPTFWREKPCPEYRYNKLVYF